MPPPAPRMATLRAGPSEVAKERAEKAEAVAGMLHAALKALEALRNRDMAAAGCNWSRG